MILPDAPVFVGEPVFLLAQPVGLVGAGFGDEVDFESRLLEHVKWVEGFGDEESCNVSDLAFECAEEWIYRSPCRRGITARGLR